MGCPEEGGKWTCEPGSLFKLPGRLGVGVGETDSYTPWLHHGNDHSSGTSGETNCPASFSMDVVLCICSASMTMLGWQGADVGTPLRTPTR